MDFWQYFNGLDGSGIKAGSEWMCWKKCNPIGQHSKDQINCATADQLDLIHPDLSFSHHYQGHKFQNPAIGGENLVFIRSNGRKKTFLGFGGNLYWKLFWIWVSVIRSAFSEMSWFSSISITLLLICCECLNQQVGNAFPILLLFPWQSFAPGNPMINPMTNHMINTTIIFTRVKY